MVLISFFPPLQSITRDQPWGEAGSPGPPLRRPLPAGRQSRCPEPVAESRSHLHHCTFHSPKTTGEPGEKSSQRGVSISRRMLTAAESESAELLLAERGCREMCREPRWVRAPLTPAQGTVEAAPVPPPSGPPHLQPGQ